MVASRTYVPDRGDVVWLRFDPQAGHEQTGHRPAVVLSPRAYNRRVGLALFCAVTSQVKGYPFEVPLDVGAELEGVILTDQIKSLDWRASRASKLTRVSQEVMAEVTARLLALVDPG